MDKSSIELGQETWKLRYVLATADQETGSMLDHFESPGGAHAALSESVDSRPLCVLPGLVCLTKTGSVREWHSIVLPGGSSSPSDLLGQVAALLLGYGWQINDGWVVSKNFPTEEGNKRANIAIHLVTHPRYASIGLFGSCYNEGRNVLESTNGMLDHASRAYLARDIHRYVEEAEQRIAETFAANLLRWWS